MGTCIIRNKLDEGGRVIRNKARLGSKGYSWQKVIDYTKTCAPIARLEVIRIILSFAMFNEIILYQIDVKSAFLNDDIKEEVYVEQPPSFECQINPTYVFRLYKALYGLK